MYTSEALAALAASPVDTLKHAALPASWSALGWQTSTGVWSKFGLRSPAYAKGLPAGDGLAIYHNTGKLAGNAAALVTKTEGGQAEGEQWDVWLHATPGTKPTGYQAVARGFGVGAEFYELEVCEWQAGVKVNESLGGAYLEQPLAGIAVVKAGHSIQAWYQEEEEAGWEAAAAIASTTFTEGYWGLGGNGTTPLLIDASAGNLKLTWSALAHLAVTLQLAADLVAPLHHAAARITAGTVLSPRLEPDAEARADLSLSPRILPHLRPDRRAGAAVDVEPALIPSLRKDRRAVSELPAAVEMQATAQRLPQSQHVFLSFQLDRTLVPYIAERR